MRNILKISAQAKRDYTFQCIYLLLRCLHLLDVAYRDWHIMSVLKIPSARSLKTFITAVIVLITASTIPETFFYWHLFDNLKFLIFVEGSCQKFLLPRINHF